VFTPDDLNMEKENKQKVFDKDYKNEDDLLEEEDLV